MQDFVPFLLGALGLLGAACGNVPTPAPAPTPTPATSGPLAWVLQVAGRQGVAVDAQNYYISGSKALYKYNKAGELLLSNTQPFSNYTVEANHIGDIDVHDGEIFAGAEYFNDGASKNIQIAVYDAESLMYKRSLPFEPSSGQLEVAGVTVDPDHNLVWMCSWLKGESGRYLYAYELQGGTYVRKLELDPVPKQLQGINYHKGFLWLTADDGDADLDKYDHVYKVASEGANAGKVVLAKTMDGFRKTGEIEGLAWDDVTGELVVFNNRGMKIVNGMPIRPYPGYIAEVHEVYVYSSASEVHSFESVNVV